MASIIFIIKMFVHILLKDIEFDVETCSEVYKEYIRDSKYGDTTQGNTSEKMIFIYKNKTYIMEFRLDFSFDFENGFNYTYFSDFVCKPKTKQITDKVFSEFENYIRNHFVTTDRLSC